jgi:HAE1 family hydrophobic/amphiphilic exporter-1
MWLVNLALRRPYFVWVGMLLTLVLGLLSYARTPTDILPTLKVPVVVVFASYRGMPAPDMENTVVAPLERVLTRCDNLDHIESRSLLGIGIIRLYFRPEVNPDVAAAQVNALVYGELQFLPPGMQPPGVFKYDASSIPVGSLVITSDRHDDKYLLDLADHELRDELAGVEGLAAAPVFGGVFRQIQIYARPESLEAYRLSPFELAGLVNKQSQVFPGAELRLHDQNFLLGSNSMARTPREFEDLPLWSEGRKVVYLRDVARVEDGVRWRTNTVRVDGRRAVFMPLLRQGGASAIRVVDDVQEALREIPGKLPDKMEDVNVEVAFDQSQYVRESLDNLRWEACGGALLAALVVLLFLGSLRGTWIVALAIPLSALAAFVGLYYSGHTLNIMTLGGLALVLGRVVDDSIVDVENTSRHLEMGKSPEQAVRDSAAEISAPIFVATVVTVIVFLPVTLMSGMGKYLFTPLAFSATLAMFASYVVSRTVSPVCCVRLLRPHTGRERFPRTLLATALVLGIFGGIVYAAAAVTPVASWLPRAAAAALAAAGLLAGVALIHRAAPLFHRGFERLTGAYIRALGFCLRWRYAVLGLVAAGVAVAFLASRRLDQELFPEVDSGDFTVHMRVAGGPRVEETERVVADVERVIRGDPTAGVPAVIPAEDLEMVLSNVGLSSRWSAIYSPNNGPHAAAVRVQLRSGFAGRRVSTAEYVGRLRARLAEEFPGNDFFFETGGMIRRILNAGAVAPIEVRIRGRNDPDRRDFARRLNARLARLPEVRDTYLPQGMYLPQLIIQVDRSRAAQQFGFTELDVMRSVFTALMSSAQIAPNLWIDRSSGNQYLIGVQFPEDAVRSIQSLEDIPISSEKGRPAGGGVRKLKELATVEHSQGPLEVYRHAGEPVSQLFLNVVGNDLRAASETVRRVVGEMLLDYAIGSLPLDKLGLAADTQFLERLEEYFRAGTKSQRGRIIKEYGVDPEKLRHGLRVDVHGEVASMADSFRQMALSLALAVVLVYLIMAAQFGSWLDPLIMVIAAPLGVIGVVLALWATDTSLNIQSLMGVLMMVGISVSNSVLLVDFANRERETGLGARDAALSAARVRLRPILMTTAATILGLLPMAMHLRPGDEMNLPLARAVIGGLAGSTVLTLFVVPILYVLLRRDNPAAVPAAPNGVPPP